MDKQIFIENDTFGFYEDHNCRNLNDAIAFANKAALYQHKRDEADYKKAKRIYDNSDAEDKDLFLKPTIPFNFTIKVLIRVAETTDEPKYRPLYSISRNKIREMEHFGLINYDPEWEPFY